MLNLVIHRTNNHTTIYAKECEQLIILQSTLFLKKLNYIYNINTSSLLRYIVFMNAVQRNLAILLCTVALVSAYFLMQKRMQMDEYDRLML